MRITRRQLRQIIRESIEGNPWGKISGFTFTEADMIFWSRQLGIRNDHPLHPDYTEYRTKQNGDLFVYIGAHEYNMWQVDDKIASDWIKLFVMISEFPKGNWKPRLYASGAYFGGANIVDPEDIQNPANAKGMQELFDNWLNYVRGE